MLDENERQWPDGREGTARMTVSFQPKGLGGWRVFQKEQDYGKRSFGEEDSNFNLKMLSLGNSLAVQWLGFSTVEVTGSSPGQGVKVPQASRPKKQNIKNRSSAVTNSIKTLKVVHI